MPITDLTIPYPDFKMYEVIDSEQFDANNAQIIAKMNEIVQILGSVVGGTLNDNIIGSSVQVNPIEPFVSTDVQALFAEISTRLRSVADGLSGADLIGSTLITGVDGTTVQSQLESIKGLIDALILNDEGVTEGLAGHKISADHDARYYTKTLADEKMALNVAGNHAGTWAGYSIAEVLSASGTGFGTIEVLSADPVNPDVGRIWILDTQVLP